MLTGVRGVGKTTPAPLLARALNYERQAVDATLDMDGRASTAAPSWRVSISTWWRWTRPRIPALRTSAT